MAEFAESDVLTLTVDGEDYTVDAILGSEYEERKSVRNGFEVYKERTAQIKQTEVPDGLTLHAAAAVGSATGYAVAEIGAAIGGMVTLVMRRHARMDFSGDNYEFE